MRRLEVAILGLIVESPKYGYEIDKVIEKRKMRVWADIAFSSIYSTLRGLEKVGLVTVHKEQEGDKPPRKIYHITPKGVEELKTAVREMLSKPTRSNFDFNLGLANLNILSKDEALSCLNEYSANLKKEIARLEGVWKSRTDRPFNRSALFDHNLNHLRSEKAWVEKFIDQLEERSNFE